MRENRFYSLPLRFDYLISKKEFARCSVKESISQNLYLLLTTQLKDNRYNPEYGCRIWEEDFEVISTIKWKDKIKAYVEEVLNKFERRLINNEIRVEIDEIITPTISGKRIKKRIRIWLEGNIARTNEKFSFFEEILVSPLSVV